ncbi:hypothetical protein PCANC_11849 [Puccinia coronata f. sp. avenae]|uniref:Uncharacterized protein n=1 Tax=Puccinia coronata f. sp. avenae TaxID=200324 RepID=A0A2N5SV14_9BASI|nr:hypothetical protein PCANC_11849 [Puccinia coronata f. sp. avenae]
MFFNGASRVAAEKTGQLWGLIAARPKGAERHSHAFNRHAYGVQPCQTGVQSLHACLEGVQSLHTIWTGVQALHACWLT